MTSTLEQNASYAVLDIPMSILYHDDTFNCRGVIAPMDVATLAKAIDTNGLQFPITVQPVCDIEGAPLRDELTKQKIEYRIIAGHRRHKACTCLGWKSIPCMIRRGLSEAQARVLNLSENFDREDLNIVQEAEALKHLELAGIPRDDVATMINKSSGWVQVRYYLLRMPKPIQEEAAAGFLNQYQIKKLYSMETEEEMFDAVKKIKDAKAKGEKPPEVGGRKKKSTTVKKERKRGEMSDMQDIIRGALGNGRDTRALAWAAGEISTAELFADIAREAEAMGKHFVAPIEF